MLAEDCPLTGIRRITLEQAIQFTTQRGISAVTPIIYQWACQYNIDPAFALAEAILETGWGTSRLARNRHNWYGYQAYFENPDRARYFATDEDGIRIPLSDMAHNYFDPAGPFYAGGSGSTLAGWAENWVDGTPAHWQDAVSQILQLMGAMCRMANPS